MSSLPLVQGFLASEKSKEKHPLILRKALDGLSWEDLTDGQRGQWLFNQTDWSTSVLQKGEFVLHNGVNPDAWLIITDPELIKWLVLFSKANGRKYQKRDLVWQKVVIQRITSLVITVLIFVALYEVFVELFAKQLGLHLPSIRPY